MLSRLTDELGGVPTHGASVDRIAREDLFAAYVLELAGPLSDWQVIQQIKSVCRVGVVTAERYRTTLVNDGRLEAYKDDRKWYYRAPRRKLTE